MLLLSLYIFKNLYQLLTNKMPIDFNLLVESLTAVIAGSIVSLLNRFVINNPNCQIVQECQNIEREVSESDMSASSSSTTASTTVVTNTSSPHTHIPHTHIPN